MPAKMPKWKLVKREDREGIYYVRFFFKGKQPYLSTGLGNIISARVKAAEIVEKYVLRHGAGELAKSDLLFSNCISEYLKARYIDNPETGATNGRRIAILQAALETDMVDDLTEATLRAAYHKIKASRAYQAHYWQDLIVAWKAAFRWMYRNKKIRTPADDLFENIKSPKSDTFRKVVEILPDSDFEKVLSTFEKKSLDWDTLVVMRYSSINPSDVYELEKIHIQKDPDPDNQTGFKLIKARAKAKSSLEEYKQPLNSKAAEVLLRRCEGKNGHDKLFAEIVDESAYAFGNNLSKRWNRHFKSALPGRPVLKLTILRHCFITYYIKLGVAVGTLRRWVGHSPHSKELDATYDHYEHTAEAMNDAEALAKVG